MFQEAGTMKVSKLSLRKEKLSSAQKMMHNPLGSGKQKTKERK